MNNTIEFIFDNGLEVLAGNPFGRETYFSQMASKFCIDSKNVLVFPESIDMICSSFVQGLFSELLKSFTPQELIEKLVIENQDHKNDIIEGLVG